jgi:hypothetical protein
MNISAKDKVIDQQFMAALKNAKDLATKYLNAVAIWENGDYLFVRTLPVGDFDAAAREAGWQLRAKITKNRVQIFG